MDANNLTNFLKLLLDLKNFKNAFLLKKEEIKSACARCNSDKMNNSSNIYNSNNNNKKIMNSFEDFDEDFELNDVTVNETEQCICMIEYNKS